jgi:xanthine dehydrogenase YagT iron-sulfur-binding subunit
MDAQVQTPPSSPAAVDGLPITLQLNGFEYTTHVQPWVTLLDLLREEAHLTGTKKGCDHGQCGACTVLLDGKRVNSCLQLAVSVDGSTVQTIEGLGTGEDGARELDPLQQAFMDHDAFQCGYCTPGQICSARGLLSEGKARTREEVRELMSGNLCRCGAYTNITDAVMSVLSTEGAAK